MIIFKEIAYKNFLSSGDHFTRIDLNKTLTSIFVGVNGAGKSTFIDAIVYALFGKPYRKVKLGQLINNVNERELVCEITFSIGNKEYIVKRGMKPSLFEIYVDGEMIEQPATTADYQAILENDILKLNFKSFTQIIILGSASFKPFMQLKLGDRREIIEDLLDISVFTQMNTILKAKIKETKDILIEETHNFELIKERYTSKYEYLEKAKYEYNNRTTEINESICEHDRILTKAIEDLSVYYKRKDDLVNMISQVNDVDAQIDDFKKRISTINIDILTKQQIIDVAKKDLQTEKELQEKIEVNMASLKRGYDKLSELEEELRKIVAVIESYGDFGDRDQVKTDIALKANHRVSEKEKIKFYTSHDDCPECKQHIDPVFREETIASSETIVKTYDDELVVLNDRLKTIEREMKEKADFIESKRKLEKDVITVKTAIDKLETQNKMMVDNISSLQLKSCEEIVKIEDDIILKKVEVAAIEEDIATLKVTSDTLTQLKNELIVVEREISLNEMTKSTNITYQQNRIDEFEEVEGKGSFTSEETEIEELSANIKEITASIKKLNTSLHYFGIVQRLLKDDGLKTKIIKRFLPVINATVNKYLDKFDFPINFNFDENFNETIESNFRHEFCYYSFSEGEKSRIDLALLFTWREIALKKSRNATNIIIFDEIFDGSLDVAGTENFMSILGLDKGGYNSFIISHKDDTINSRFDRTLEFVKKGHFSKMMEK